VSNLDQDTTPYSKGILQYFHRVFAAEYDNDLSLNNMLLHLHATFQIFRSADRSRLIHPIQTVLYVASTTSLPYFLSRRRTMK
jgi:hypothetical protein